MIEQRYSEIVAAIDAEFERNRELHGNRMQCRAGCSECCYHVFTISDLEAERIAAGMASLNPELRKSIEERASAYVAERLLKGTRMPCPALEKGVCSIYELRPLMCHKFGMPLYNPEKPDRIFACELNFRDGEEIQDPDLIQIQTGIHHDWKRLQAEYDATHGSGHTRRRTIAEAILGKRARLSV